MYRSLPAQEARKGFKHRRTGYAMHFRRRCAASTIRVTPAMKFILPPENHSCVDIHFGALGGGGALKGPPCSPEPDGMREIGGISMGLSWEIEMAET